MVFHAEDFYSFGLEAGKAWKGQYGTLYADTYLQHIASEVQARTYHLSRACFPSEIVNAWEQGFRTGAMGE